MARGTLLTHSNQPRNTHEQAPAPPMCCVALQCIYRHHIYTVDTEITHTRVHTPTPTHTQQQQQKQQQQQEEAAEAGKPYVMGST